MNWDSGEQKTLKKMWKMFMFKNKQKKNVEYRQLTLLTDAKMPTLYVKVCTKYVPTFM